MVCGDILNDTASSIKATSSMKVIKGAYTVPDDFEAINEQLDGMKALNLKGSEQAGFARLPNPLPLPVNTLYQNA
jgi:hypothetical protein